MLAQAEAAPSSTTPTPNHSAPGDRTQSRPPAAVVAFPQRNSNFARACVASLDLTPGCRITANTIADFAAVHSRPAPRTQAHRREPQPGSPPAQLRRRGGR